MSSILLLTASFGEGHNAAARSVADALREFDPITEEHPVVWNAFEAAYGRTNRFAEAGYREMISRAPGLWKHAFNLFHRTRFIENSIGWLGLSVRELVRQIERVRPAGIVTTYPGYPALIAQALRRGLRKEWPFIVIVTDVGEVNAVWHRSPADAWLVADEFTRRVLIDRGVDPEKVHALGFPVGLGFSKMEIIRRPPGPDLRPRVLYIVNAEQDSALQTVRTLQTDHRFRLTVTYGKDEALGDRLRKALDAGGSRTDLFGWTPRLPELMASNHLILTKAGGATIQEAIAAGTPLLINKVVPGQEEGNAELVQREKIGTLATTPKEILRTIQSTFEHRATIWSGWEQNIRNLRRPDASYRIARFVLKLCR